MAMSLTAFRQVCEAPQTSTAITFMSERWAPLGKRADCLDHLDWAAGGRPECSRVRTTLPRMAPQVFICLVRNDFGARVQPSTTAASADSCNSESTIQKHSRSIIISVQVLQNSVWFQTGQKIPPVSVWRGRH